MPVEVIMPKVDMDMASGKIMTWHVAEGEAVEKGDPLFDIETDKAAMEVESPGSGLLHHMLPEGSDVPIGQTIAWLYSEGEEVGPPPDGATTAETPAELEHAGAEVEPEVEASGETVAVFDGDVIEKTRATPRARSLAREAGLDLSRIAGTGPRGRVQGDDIRSALDRAPAPAAPTGFTPDAGGLAVTRSKGGTGTPLILIHGFASDALSWAPLEATQEGRSVIRIDLPCHGKSPKKRLPDFAALAALLRQTLDGLEIDTAHLVGHSLGGALALALADTRPRRIASLTLIAPAGLGPEINGDVLMGILRATQPASLGPWLKALVAEEKLVTDAYVRLAMAGRENPDLRASQLALAGALFPDGVQAFDMRAALSRIETPTRIIWGKADRVIPWRHALSAPGRVSLNLFDGVGHMPQIEAPEAVGKLLSTLP